MIRKFNYTGRQRIPNEQVDLAIRRNGSSPPEFDATIDLSGLQLPATANVYVEAYRRTSYKRFPFGTVGAIAAPPDRSLTDIDQGDVFYFRVKVVEETKGVGLILAEADRLSVGDLGELKTICHVNHEPLGQQMWRLDIEMEMPVLVVNSEVPEIDWHLRSNGAFASLVYPEVVRRILYAILLPSQTEEIPDPDDPDEWASLWIRYAENLSGSRRPSGSSVLPGWIDQVVRAFCERFRARDQFERQYGGAR